MTDDQFALYAAQHTLGDDPIPGVVLDLAGGLPPELVWRNDLGGLTFRIGTRYVKWNPRRTGIDLERERVRLEWISARHPAPRVVAAGGDDEAQWLVTEALTGDSAVGDTWRAGSRGDPGDRAGLRAILAFRSTTCRRVDRGLWVAAGPRRSRPPPPVSIRGVHGDACAPNTSSPTRGVDRQRGFGDLAVGDAGRDSRSRSLSLDWNFGEATRPSCSRLRRRP